MRIVSSWALGLRAGFLALAAALFLAMPAFADTPSATEGAAPPTPVVPAVEEALKAAPEAASEPPAVPAVEEVVDATPEAPSEPPAVAAVEEVVHATPEAAPEPPAVAAVEEVVQATPEAPSEPPAVAAVEEALTTPPELPVPEAVPVPVAVSEESAGIGAGGSSTEPPSEATPLPPPVSEAIEETGASGKLSSGEESLPTSAASGTDLPPKPPLPASGTPLQPPSPPSGPGEGAAEAAGPLVVAATPTIGDPGETWPIGAAALRAPGTPAGAAAPQPARASCDQSVLTGPITDCTAGWLGSPSSGPGAPVSLDAATISWVVGSSSLVSPGGDVHEDPAIGARPAAPVPGPAPGGASGAASGGGSGFALSAFLTLTGLLLLAAPRALRRLRLRCEPWLTAFFVLIPERPG